MNIACISAQPRRDPTESSEQFYELKSRKKLYHDREMIRSKRGRERIRVLEQREELTGSPVSPRFPRTKKRK